MIEGYPIFDLHVHTHHSSCACQEPAYSVGNILAQAARLGFDGISFADHAGDNRGVPEAMGVRRMEALQRELAGLGPSAAPPFRIGLEADEGWAPAAAKGRFLVLVSCNDNYEPADLVELKTCPPRQFAEYLLARTRRALQSDLITMLPHPLLARGRTDAVEVFASYRPEELGDVLQRARDRGVIIELHRHLVEDAKLIGRKDAVAFCQLARDIGVRLSFGTDSHQPWHLAGIGPLVAFARYAGLAPGDFIQEFPQPPS